ncbi:MAG TPA: hypothetical protein VND64_00530 [Pirellulales bacterium]|nr:hypothetical protein [Pirellulales bacterium]
MAQSDDLLPLYLHLARASQRRNRPWVRDKLLVLSGAAAAERGLDMVASFCRRTILANNPRHLVGHHPTMAAAMEDERFQGHLAQLRRRYTRERAEHMLGSLGIDLARERDAYFTLHEYAAALLGTTPAELEALFGDVDEAGEGTSPPSGAQRSTAGSHAEHQNEQEPSQPPHGDGIAAHAQARRAVRYVLIVLGVIAVALVSLAAALLRFAR